MKLVIQGALDVLSGPIWVMIGLFFLLAGWLHIFRRVVNFLSREEHHYDCLYDDDWEPESPILRPFWANRRDPNDPIRKG